MSDVIKIDVQGLKQLFATIDTMPDRVGKKIVKRAAREAARPVLETAKQLAPVNTGLMRGALKIRALKRTRRSRRIGVRIVLGEGFFKGHSFYGAFQELGTKKMAARRFMRDAKDQHEGTVREIFRQKLKAIIAEEKSR